MPSSQDWMRRSDGGKKKKRGRKTNLNPNPMCERHIRRIEIMRSPTQKHRIERDNKRRESRFLDAGEERERYVV